MQRWQESRLFEAHCLPRVKKLFVTVPDPYMSGPLDLSTAYTTIRADAYARFKRLQGYNVLFPYAWQWTGDPIASISQRVKEKDPTLLRLFSEVDKVPAEEISKFHDPKSLAEYFTNEGRSILRRLGASIDWRREFHTTSYNKHYSRFITWQYTRLREKGYVSLDTHPVVWCPRDNNPTDDHDRIEGKGVAPEEYTLVKFPMGEVFLPCATLRPETVFGVTNLWVNPEATYLRIRIDGKEEWIVGKEAAFKLKEQSHEVEALAELKGEALVGKTCTEPVTGRNLLVLPATFVESETGTGLVYSVPAHSPYDWLALRDLQSHRELREKFHLTESALMEIKPIYIIHVDAYGGLPAVEIVDRLGILDQSDPKAREATDILYKKESHAGVMTENTGKYRGSRVAEVKERILRELKKKKIAEPLWDLPRRVICRCTQHCIVKVLENQWFLRYSDNEWKAKVRQLIEQATFLPAITIGAFEQSVERIHDHACTKRGVMGTPLPWDPSWIIEALSDSTVYMSYYIISKYVNDGDLAPEQLTPKFFDYVFNDKGSVVEVSRETDMSPLLIQRIHKDFNYWYPVDLRVASKQLIPNPLIHYMFHHTALFRPEHWPKGIAVNGAVRVKGQALQKSMGNFVSLKDALNRYGADAVRVALLGTTEGVEDHDWRDYEADEASRSIKSFVGFLRENLTRTDIVDGKQNMDSWLISRLQKHIARVSEALEALKTKTAFNTAYYGIWNDLKWYLHRVRNPNRTTLRYAIETWLRLLLPFIPFACSELWRESGGAGFISKEVWPDADENLIDNRSEFEEEYRRRVLDDSKAIMKLLKTPPVTVHYYTSERWKWEVLKAILSESYEVQDQGKLTKRLMQKTDNKERGAELMKNAPALIALARELSPAWRQAIANNHIDETHIITEGKDFFEKELGIPISVQTLDYAKINPKSQSQNPIPTRPVIYLETK